MVGSIGRAIAAVRRTRRATAVIPIVFVVGCQSQPFLIDDLAVSYGARSTGPTTVVRIDALIATADFDPDRVLVNAEIRYQTPPSFPDWPPDSVSLAYTGAQQHAVSAYSVSVIPRSCVSGAYVRLTARASADVEDVEEIDSRAGLPIRIRTSLSEDAYAAVGDDPFEVFVETLCPVAADYPVYLSLESVDTQFRSVPVLSFAEESTAVQATVIVAARETESTKATLFIDEQLNNSIARNVDFQASTVRALAQVNDNSMEHEGTVCVAGRGAEQRPVQLCACNSLTNTEPPCRPVD